MKLTNLAGGTNLKVKYYSRVSKATGGLAEGAQRMISQGYCKLRKFLLSIGEETINKFPFRIVYHTIGDIRCL